MSSNEITSSWNVIFVVKSLLKVSWLLSHLWQFQMWPQILCHSSLEIGLVSISSVNRIMPCDSQWDEVIKNDVAPSSLVEHFLLSGMAPMTICSCPNSSPWLSPSQLSLPCHHQWNYSSWLEHELHMCRDLVWLFTTLPLRMFAEALPGMSQCVGHCPANWKITGLIPGQCTCLDFGLGPQLGACKRQLIGVSLTHQCFPLPTSPP